MQLAALCPPQLGGRNQPDLDDDENTMRIMGFGLFNQVIICLTLKNVIFLKKRKKSLPIPLVFFKYNFVNYDIMQIPFRYTCIFSNLIVRLFSDASI